MQMDEKKTEALIFGHAVGDARGVPVEFQSRTELQANPVHEMRGFGTYPVPAGSWSDDTSMTIALLESLVRVGHLDFADVMENFCRWMDEAAFTLTGGPHLRPRHHQLQARICSRRMRRKQRDG